MKTQYRNGLSKSRIAAFEQCPKRLWLSIHRPELGETDPGAEARFATGNAVGDLACALHPEGVMVEAEPNLSAAVDLTAKLLDEGHPGPIFEATFEHQGVLVRVDVLERRDGGSWYAAEVKSSTRVKDYHRGDLATQIWVMRESGIELKGAAIRHLDNRFELSCEGDYSGIFTDADLLDEVEDICSSRPEVVSAAREVLAGDEPEREIGDHCSSPHSCQFAGYCSRLSPQGPEWPVTILPNGAGRKWAEKGVEDLLELSEHAISERQARVLAATRDNVPFHDAQGAQKAISRWGWPRAWLDFETVNPAIPRWIGTRPYQQVPFQFSLHLEQIDGTITHHEFLSIDGSDPRRGCAEALVRLVPRQATIIAYNASFEQQVLRALAAWFADLSEPLLAMVDRTVDLLPVARNTWYHRDQRGSWSIKSILPTIAPELDYASLEVKDGGNAQAAWYEAADPDCTPSRREALAEALKAYCERDTWAMVAVARGLTGELD